MRKILLLITLLFITSLAFAAHIKGGFFTYKYIGSGANGTLRYSVTLTVYMDCNATSNQINENIFFSFYEVNGDAFSLWKDVPVSRDNTTKLVKASDDQCITGNQAGCYYTVVTYVLSSVDLPSKSGSYMVSYQRCCRISGVDNIVNSATVGNTYSVEMPGNTTVTNSSATFEVNDTAVVCANSPFTLAFSAKDPDGDQLRYEFCNAWEGGSQANPAPATAASPPYSSVNYNGSFNGTQPLGSKVSIDPVTGIISGIAPDIQNTGEYVVTVCVTELRGGVVVGTTRKELHIKVGNCTPVIPTLEKEYVNCNNTTIAFENLTPSSEIKTYSWDFGVSGTNTDVSNQPNPTFTFPAPGNYTVNVEVNKGQACSGTTTALVKVYPGFTPNFDVSGICIQAPSQFNDKTVTQHGVVDKWTWDFGETTSQSDASTAQNPSYKYPQAGIKSVRLIVGSNLGCLDTVIKQIEIFAKPPLQVLTKDTLMCNGDTTQLKAFGSGVFTWTPVTTISGGNTDAPSVWPSVTTTYHVQLNDNGCINTDSTKVRVVNFVTLQAMNDTTICLTDSVQLNATTNGLKLLWTPSGEIDNPTIVNPKARPSGASTTYTITSRIGRCVDQDQVIVKTVPYPNVSAGEDMTICYETPTQLEGQTDGAIYNWSPPTSLSNPTILNPIASPLTTTAYILSASNPNTGCPKPIRDTVLITVLPEILANAGRDTAVVVGQPVQFLATGGTSYSWTPGTGLSNTSIPNPTGLYDGSFESIRYKVLVGNGVCTDSAFVTVRVFKTPPQIFIPTGFTPNNDSRNDIIRPIAVGITKIEYFRIFNRWGELVFSTTTNGEGWNGKMKGKDQGTGVYAWVVKAIDYTGKEFFAKGTVTLIR